MKKYIEKVFCEGTWKHKYNEAMNEKLAELFGEPNDRTSADVGVEMEPLENNN